MRKDIIRQAVNVAAFILTVVVNWMATSLPLNGQTPGAISDRFPVFFVPAGYVFSIWGLIYLAARVHGLPGAAGPESQPATARHRLLVCVELPGQQRVDLLLALQRVPAELVGDARPPRQPDRDLPQTGYRADGGQHYGKVGG